MTGAPASPIRIAIADDHAMVRGGLRMLLSAQDDLEVVAEAGDVDGALDAVRAQRPAVLVIDLSMPGRATLPAIPDLLAAAPGTAVVVMTMHGEAAYAQEALAAGATGFVLKDAAETELAEAVRMAAAGSTYVDPAMSARLATPPGHTSTADELAPGARFAGHRIEGIAGRGGMGVVYRAVDEALDRRVALKLLAGELGRDPVFRARFERECRLTAAIDHPRVVQVFQAGEEAGQLYVSMRLVDGTDLRALLAAQRRLEAARAARIVAHVADALQAAHEHGLVHRDVKPGNVLVTAGPGGEDAFLTDFGITKQRDAVSDLTGTGVAMGTPDYISPEQVRGDPVDARADVYALGCVLHQALTGRVPFDHEGAIDKLWAHLHEEPPSVVDLRPDVPQGLGAVVARALAKDPADRQQSAAQLGREALAAAL